MTEFEYKFILSKEQYNSILMTLKNDYSTNSFIQVNYFYDSMDYDLHKNNITLRVRQKEEDLQLELKCPVYKEGALNVRNELFKVIDNLPISIDLDKTEWNTILPYTGRAFLIGTLITERTKCYLRDYVEIDLDKNIYLGIVDYELEVEFIRNNTGEALNLAKEIIGELIIRPSLEGKRCRFYRKLNK